MKIKNKFYLRGRKIVKYDAVQKEVDGMSDVVVTNVYSLMEVLNECIDDYHERHKHG